MLEKKVEGQAMDYEKSSESLSDFVHPDVDPKYIYQPSKKPVNYYEKLGEAILDQQPNHLNFLQGFLIHR